MKILVSEQADIDGLGNILDRMKGLNVTVVTKNGEEHTGEIEEVDGSSLTPGFVRFSVVVDIPLADIETVTYL